MNLQEILWLVGVVAVGIFLLPLALFRVVLLCTYAFYLGRHRFRQHRRNDRRDDGQASRKA